LSYQSQPPPDYDGYFRPPPQQYQPPQGWQQQPKRGRPPGPPRAPRRRKRHTFRNLVLGVIALIVVIIVAVNAGSGGGKTPAASAGTNAGAPATQPAATTAPAATSPPPAAPQHSPAQQQAINAAEGYLSDGQGFSRKGLIQQLSSPDGSGFSKSLATFAVRHVQVSWRQQAVIAAKGYMSDGQGFSYAGLVQQLESPYGDSFTPSQAAYGAKSAGL
jgi:hypothetical protein